MAEGAGAVVVMISTLIHVFSTTYYPQFITDNIDISFENQTDIAVCISPNYYCILSIMQDIRYSTAPFNLQSLSK